MPSVGAVCCAASAAEAWLKDSVSTACEQHKQGSRDQRSKLQAEERERKQRPGQGVEKPYYALLCSGKMNLTLAARRVKCCMLMSASRVEEEGPAPYTDMRSAATRLRGFIVARAKRQATAQSVQRPFSDLSWLQTASVPPPRPRAGADGPSGPKASAQPCCRNRAAAGATRA